MKKCLKKVVFGCLLFTVTSLGQGFSVDGTQLLDANGNEFIIRGVNYAYAWFTGTVNQSLTAIADAGANTVRIVLADGDQWNEVSSSEVETLLDVCNQEELIAVLEVHDATGDDNIQSLRNAANYFVGLKDVLDGKENRVIINIANEWYGSWNTNPWAEGYIEVIGTLRDAGLTHTIMVDCAGYGQYPSSVHERGTDVFSADPLSNTMFSIHMYEYSGGTCSDVENNIDQTLNKGLALCIGEFGHRHSAGDVAEQCILDHCQQEGVGWMAWSWHGNSSDVGYLDLANDASGSSLTDWGNTIVYGTNGLKETAQKASIFSSISRYSRKDLKSGNGASILKVNPASSSRLSIYYSIKDFVPYRLMILNSSGRRIHSRSLSTSEGMINIENSILSSGMYLMQIYGDKGGILRKTLINLD